MNIVRHSNEYQYGIYPWQVSQWDYLHQARQVHKLPHAILFQGISGLGKHQFIRTWVNTLLCIKVNQNGQPCLCCHHCHMIHAGSHPNVLWIRAESLQQTIKIEQIRMLTHFIHQTVLQEGLCIAIIEPIDCLNDYASNALLKTLEEPPAGVLLLLVHQQYRPILPTIVSRCQRVIFRVPIWHVAYPWLQQQLAHSKRENREPKLLLQLSRGAPLAALDWAIEKKWKIRQDVLQTLFLLGQQWGDPLQPAARWAKEDSDLLLTLIEGWVMDLLRLQIGVEVINEDHLDALQRLQNHCATYSLLDFIDRLQKRRRILLGNGSIIRQLQLEAILIDWMNRVVGK